MNGSTSVNAIDVQSIAVIIQGGQNSATTSDAINLQDIRQEVSDNNMQLATVEITDIALSSIDATALLNEVGSSPAQVKVTLQGGDLLFQTEPGLTLSQIVAVVSIDNGSLQVNPSSFQLLENEIKSTQQGSRALDITITIDNAPSNSYNFNLELGLTTNGKVAL